MLHDLIIPQVALHDLIKSQVMLHDLRKNENQKGNMGK